MPANRNPRKRNPKQPSPFDVNRPEPAGAIPDPTTTTPDPAGVMPDPAGALPETDVRQLSSAWPTPVVPVDPMTVPEDQSALRFSPASLSESDDRPVPPKAGPPVGTGRSAGVGRGQRASHARRYAFRRS